VPEGDSIHRVARRLRPRLEGRRLVDARVRGDVRVAALVGKQVAAVESRGKHLLVRAAEGPTVRVHLGMRGRWRRFEPGARWRRPRRLASLILATDDDVLACFRAQVEVLHGPRPEQARSLVGLGPDLLDDDLDPERVTQRVLAAARADPGRPVGVLLLDQRVAAGLGNVYKSEVLFLGGVDPRTPAGALDRATVHALYELGVTLMRANLGSGWRITRGVLPGEPPHRPGEARYYVYGRAGRPCFRCGGRVGRLHQGEQARSTYWCPACQPGAQASGGAGEGGSAP
jgi:endonuclease-8